MPIKPERPGELDENIFKVLRATCKFAGEVVDPAMSLSDILESLIHAPMEATLRRSLGCLVELGLLEELPDGRWRPTRDGVRYLIGVTFDDD